MDASPTDYLDKIAPKTVKRPVFEFNLKTIILLAIAAVFVIIVIAVIANSISSGKTAPWQKLSVRLTNTEEIVKNSGKAIKNSQLRSLNSGLNIYLANTQRDLKDPFATMKINPKKLPTSLATNEAATHEEMLTRLETGRLNAKYDSTYAREMSYQLSTILSLYQELYSQAGPQTKQTLETAYENLQPIQKAVADFTASNE